MSVSKLAFLRNKVTGRQPTNVLVDGWLTQALFSEKINM